MQDELKEIANKEVDVWFREQIKKTDNRSGK